MAQPEAKLSRDIMAALRGRGAFVWKVHGGPLTLAGLPDIVGVYRGQFIAVESKMPGGRTSRIQDHVIARLRRAGARVVIAVSAAEALEVLDEGYTPNTQREALRTHLRSPSERTERVDVSNDVRQAMGLSLTDESEGGDFTYG